jgi:hypothetical protein
MLTTLHAIHELSHIEAETAPAVALEATLTYYTQKTSTCLCRTATKPSTFSLQGAAVWFQEIVSLCRVMCAIVSIPTWWAIA